MTNNILCKSISKLIFRLFIAQVFVLIVIDPLSGYTLTINEKIVGILYKKSIIKDVSYIEIKNNYVHIEISDMDEVYSYSYQCSQIVNIINDYNGQEISFNCDSGKGETIEIGQPVLKEASRVERDTHGSNIKSGYNAKLKKVIINEGFSNRMELRNDKIKIENDVIIIDVNCRRTNIQSTLIKTYWICGFALHKNNLFIPEIRVILHAPMRDNILITSANGSDVIELGRRNISDYRLNEQFLNKIDVYRQQK